MRPSPVFWNQLNTMDEMPVKVYRLALKGIGGRLFTAPPVVNVSLQQLKNMPARQENSLDFKFGRRLLCGKKLT
jgi:hypothetical protein